MQEDFVLSCARVSARSGLRVVFSKEASFVAANGSYADGAIDLKNNRIIINPEAKSRSGESILIHELTHAIYNDTDGSLTVAEGLETMTDAEKEKIRKRYAAVGQGSALQVSDEINAHFAEQTLSNKNILERLVQKKQTLKDKILGFFRKARTDYQSDERLTGAAARLYRQYKKLFDEFSARNQRYLGVENASAEAQTQAAKGTDNVRYSIQRIGEQDVVLVDTDQNIFDGVNPKDYPKVVRRYMLDKFQGNIYPVGTSSAYVNRRSIEEYAYSANRRASQDTRTKKMRVGTELDNLLEVAQFVKHEADDGRHPDAVRGWDKYKTYFTFDGKIIFEGEISIKLLKKGDLFYDITKIKDTSIARAAETVDGSSSASNRDVFTNNIHQNTENVNSESQKGKKFALPDTDSDGGKLTAEQREFFGKSAIVDADGKLLKMYHGTAADFTVFDIAESGASNNHTAHIGFWFTPLKAIAENFAEFNSSEYRGRRARVQEVYLNIENPKIYAPTDNSERMEELRTENTRLREQLTEEYAKLKETVGRLNYMLYFTEDNIFGRRGENNIGYRVDEDYYVQYVKMSPEQAKKAKSLVDAIKKNNEQIKKNETEYYRLQDDDSFLQMSDDLDEFMEWITGTHAHERGFGREHFAATNAREAAEQFRNKLIKEGYDGIWIKDTRFDDSGDQIVAFSPEQIKLVTNKRPTKDVDIRYALPELEQEAVKHFGHTYSWAETN